MSGTTEGGVKTSQTNKNRHGEDFYKRIGSIGGHNSNTGGFAYDKKMTGGILAREAGRKGGLKSRRNRKTEVV
jgi:general stress protein YciG